MVLNETYMSKTLPSLVATQIKRVGRNIAIARKRRNLTQAELARKAGLTTKHLSRIERGETTSGIRAYFAALWAMGLEREFDDLASPDRDEEGKRLELLRLPERARAKAENWDD